MIGSYLSVLSARPFRADPDYFESSLSFFPTATFEGGNNRMQLQKGILNINIHVFCSQTNLYKNCIITLIIQQQNPKSRTCLYINDNRMNTATQVTMFIDTIKDISDEKALNM